MPVKKPTQQELAERYGVSRKTISKWKSEGVDIYNKEAVAKHTANKQKKPPNLTEEIKESLTELNLDGATLDEVRKESIIRDVRLKDIKIKAEEGSYLPIEEMIEATIKIGTNLKAQLMRLANELPMALTGRDANEIQKKLKAAFEGLLQQQHDDFKDIVERKEE